MIQDASALSNILTQEEIDALLTPAVEEKKASTFELVAYMTIQYLQLI